MDLKDHILTLQKKAVRLDDPPARFREAAGLVSDFAAEFLRTVPDDKAYYGMHPVESGAPEPPTDGESVASILDDFKKSVLGNGVNPCSGRFFGYIPGGGLPAAALGDFLAAVTNRYSGAFGACPGAADIENQVIRWMKHLLEFPESAWGTLQSGGSLATVTAMIAARATLDTRDWARGTVYFSDQTHHCLEKALKILGVPSANWRRIPSDAKGRIDGSALDEAIARDRAAGLLPWVVSGTAGTTNTGAIDDLERLKETALREKLWLHVDAAYGGFFYLTTAGKILLASMKRGDSIVLDPHKGLFQPYGLGIVMVRDGALLKESLSFTPSYLKDVELAEPSPMDYSPELTRHFRALRLWFALKYYGLDAHVAALEEKLLLAQYAHESLKKIAGLEMGPKPELSVVTFRMAGKDGDARTARLQADLLARGAIHVSSTVFAGHLFLRLCVLSFRSHLAEIDAAVREIREVAR